jgi:phosphatidylglycerol:prolipoprotein diacylglycerol transferase
MSLYGFLIGLSFVLAMELITPKNRIIPKKKENLFFASLLFFSIIGARVYSVLSEWNYYSNNLTEIFNFRSGGLGIYGGIIFGLIFILIFSRLIKISFLKITDLIVPYLALGQSISRWGNYFNKEVFGIPTNSNFGQSIPFNLRPVQFQNFSYFHPVWLYESVLDLILFLILIKAKRNQTSLYLIGYGLIRFGLEFLRWDTWIINGIKLGQIISLVIFIFGLSILNLKNK